MDKDIKDFKYIVWVDYGSEGWTCTGYDDLKSANKHESYGLKSIITKPVLIEVKEIV